MCNSLYILVLILIMSLYLYLLKNETFEAYQGYVICPKSQGRKVKMIAGHELGLCGLKVQSVTIHFFTLPPYKGQREQEALACFCASHVVKLLSFLDSDCKHRLCKPRHTQADAEKQPSQEKVACVLVV